ncbi:hypothetical protein NL676_004091 [Syzygium grande]|nr:hypothetical protein NL676_004091 [Syzygium grande]
MGKILACTVAQCESVAIYGEKKSCVSSIEDMIDFATAILGYDIMVLFTTSTRGSKQQVMVGQVKGWSSAILENRWMGTAAEGVGDLSVEGVGNLSVEGV